MNKLLSISNGSLLVCAIALAASILLAYPFAELLSMPGQILAHIGTLLFATGIKISYVARLVSQRALGLPVH